MRNLIFVAMGIFLVVSISRGDAASIFLMVYLGALVFLGIVVGTVGGRLRRRYSIDLDTYRLCLLVPLAIWAVVGIPIVMAITYEIRP